MLDLAALARRVQYVGSSEHKRFPNPLANPSLRSDATNCDDVDPTLSQQPEMVQRVLQAAVERGQIDAKMEGGFPRHCWGRIRVTGGAVQLFEVRLTNSGLGQYKGYFIWPDDLTGKRAWLRKRLLPPDGDWAEILNEPHI